MNMPIASPPQLPVHVVAVGLHGLRHLLEELIPSVRNAEVTLIEKAYDEAVGDIAALRRRATVDAIVAAGSNGNYLRQRLDIPVVLVRVSGFDVMQGLSAARRYAGRIALVTYGVVSDEIRQFVETFALPVELRSYGNEDEARACVHELKSMDVEVVVAPGLVVDLARENGLTGMLIYSQRLVREAIEDAVEVGRLRRSEAAKRDRINTILGELRDGVVAVDTEGRIEVLNPAMEKILGQPAGRLVGRPLASFMGDLDLEPTLRWQRPELERVQRFSGRTLVTSRVPIIEQGRLTGAVLTCQDPEAIRRMDRSLRTRSASRMRSVRYGLDDIVGDSRLIADVRARVLACARSRATVLITGESGTGKELIAQSIHMESERSSQPFVAINCGAFPESLLESELFGYTEGSFTGASRGGKTGLFEAAHTGTLFLDEIGEMPLSLQTRLLRVLQEKEVLRIGATDPTPIDVRIIAATHQDLASQVAAGVFRRDLYYRLNILLIRLAPLRDRPEDLRPLIQALQKKWLEQPGDRPQLDEALVKALLEASRNYAWPGNVRELENVLERVMVLSDLYPAQGAAADALKTLVPEIFEEGAAASGSLEERRRAADLRHIKQVLRECGGNQAKAAELLNISRTTLWRRLKSDGQGAG
ncbi:propionate catabolism operon regulatory protein PrpR [Pusillimonas noertemannii]|uniref:Propionate catabolism operon transcriptional regulator n=1 Tax=Pusillimonas noertemannii TaxID=305977 RepID=A0A2U1CHI2_9BURK|nr:propionate catabolism operon regulatory protein PrpR [Pusillimonas noertemannii]PVY60391.1 propionate catabolism operon transcriptional regulator [Pusillimonas noertemannii]